MDNQPKDGFIRGYITKQYPTISDEENNDLDFICIGKLGFSYKVHDSGYWELTDELYVHLSKRRKTPVYKRKWIPTSKRLGLTLYLFTHEVYLSIRLKRIKNVA